MLRSFCPLWASLIVCASFSTAWAQEGTAYRTSLGTALSPAADGTPRYREDTGWNSPNYTQSRWVAEYGTTLSASPWIVVLQQPARTNNSLNAFANKLTLDLNGGTYSILPYFQSPSIRGGRVTIADKFGTGAFLRVTNGTLNNDFGTSSLTLIGDANAAGRLLVENGLFKANSMTLGNTANAPGFLTLETGGQVSVSNILRVGNVSGGTVNLSGPDSTLTAGRVLIGGSGVVGTVTLDAATALLHVSKTVGSGNGDLLIDNAAPSLAGGNPGVVLNAGTVLVDGNLALATGAAGRYGAVVVNGGRFAVAGNVMFTAEASDTLGGKLFLNDGRFEITSPAAFAPTADKTFYWKAGTLALTNAATTLSDTQLKNYTKQGAASYGGDRAAGTIATGQTLDASGTLTLTGGSIGLAGGTIRAANGLVANAPITGYGTLDAVVSGNGAISNATANDLVIGGLDGSNAITSAGNVVVGHRNVAATFNGASTGNGAFIKTGNALQSVTGSITNAGGVRVEGGSLEFADAGLRLATTSVDVSDVGTLRFSGGATGTANSATIGASSVAASGRLEIVGASAFTVNNSLTNNGIIELTGGTLNVGGMLVNHGQLINNGTLVATVDGTGMLSGNGVFGGPVVVQNGAMLAPGNSVGTSAFTDLTIGAGGSFELQLSNANGVAGNDWDLASVTGVLSLAATSTDPFAIILKSLDGTMSAGLLNGFDASQAWSWKFVSASISNPLAFTANAFHIDSSNFVNDLGSGGFSIAAASDGLFVNFAPQPASVPEPSSTLLFGAVGLASWGLRRRRMRRLPDSPQVA